MLVVYRTSPTSKVFKKSHSVRSKNTAGHSIQTSRPDSANFCFVCHR
ncbi:hypothetical protein B4U79_06519 [Dinothrombium tinctorium]|uniref:Uncharacterized protein n=1 Tax=Dinothrombium tinctorium TaxID=1965070 RepID=A0A3S3NW32_9ACAR|nr:hypothetical protein B4U79_06519 [Dinothrombium tinctorium]